MSSPTLGLGSSRYADDVVIPDAPPHASSAAPQTSVEQGTLMVVDPAPRDEDTWERFEEHARDYLEHILIHSTEEEADEFLSKRRAELTAIQADATRKNLPVPTDLPPMKYLQQIPKPEAFSAVVEMCAGDQDEITGSLLPPKLRSEDVRVQFDAGREATPRVDIVVKISSNGQEIAMRDNDDYIELRFRCNAGYRGNDVGGIAPETFDWGALSETTEEEVAGSSVFEFIKASQDYDKCKDKNIWQLTLTCLNAHIVGRQKDYSGYVKNRPLFKMLHKYVGKVELKICWICKASALTTRILRNIKFATKKNWAPYYIYPVLPDSLDMSKDATAWFISDIETFAGGMWGRDIKILPSGKDNDQVTTQALMYKTVPVSLDFPNEQEYVLPFAVGGMREYQYSHAHNNRLASAKNAPSAWVVSGARILKHAEEMGFTIPAQMKKHISTQEAVIEQYFYVYILVDKSDHTSKISIPAPGAGYSFEFEGRDGDRAQDKKFPWTGVVTTLGQKEQLMADFVVFVKKPRGGRFLRAYDSLKEAQAAHEGILCRLHFKDSVKVMERELLALLQLVKPDRQDLQAFRKILLHGTAIGLDIIDGTSNPYSPKDDEDTIDFTDTAQFKDLLFKFQNEPQQRSVQLAFHARGGLSLIVGPPGTGKTDTLAVIVFLGVAYGHKSLVCAASNEAVNKAFQGLLDIKELCQKNGARSLVDWEKFDPIRLYVPEAEFDHVKRPQGHQHASNIGSTEDGDDDNVGQSTEPFFKILAEFKDKTWGEFHRLTNPHYAFPDHSLSAAVSRRLDKDVVELKSKYSAEQIKAFTMDERISKDPSFELRTVIAAYNDLHAAKMTTQQLKCLRFLYSKQCFRVVNKASIIATTNNNAGCNLLANYNPTQVVVEETAQSTEASALVPLTRWPSTLLRILIGDEKQLQPTVISKECNEFSPQMSMSLFERLRKLEYEEQTILSVQYRMCPNISDFLMQHIYPNGILQNAPERLIPRPIERYVRNFNMQTFKKPCAFLMLDVPHGRSATEPNGISLVNHANVDAIADLVRRILTGMGDVQPVKTGQIEVLSYYDAQRREIHDKFREMGTDSHGNKFADIEVKTVDSSQGSQRDIVIVDTVCSLAGPWKEPIFVSSFVRSLNRVNVSLSRAMDGLYVVGSLSTWKAGRKDIRSTGDILPLLAQYVEEKNIVVSLTQYGSAPAPLAGLNIAPNRERALHSTKPDWLTQNWRR